MPSPLPRNLEKTIGSFLTDTPRRPPKVRRRRGKPPLVILAPAVVTVARFLKSRPAEWFTMADVGAAIGLSVSRVNDGMYALVRRGEAERLLPPATRGAGQKYRWVTR